VQRALAKAGDLAHGLKTPLAVLSQEARAGAPRGQAELAAALSEQIERMRRQIDYHLAHARAAASGATPGARCSIAASAERSRARCSASTPSAASPSTSRRRRPRGPLPARGSRRDARQPARQRLQVGAVPRGGDIDDPSA
jgi:hypothetical protein